MRQLDVLDSFVQLRARTPRTHVLTAIGCLTIALSIAPHRPAAAQDFVASDDLAQDEQSPDSSVLSLEQLLNVEVESVFGASKSLQKITEAPAAVTVITSDEIARFGWRTLADVLRNVRGFYVTNDRSYEYVGTRGFLRPGDYSTRVLLTIDGRRMNDNVYDQALIGEDFQIDLSEAERIEIIRGPSSSLYGSSAFFGVINVVTKTAATGRTTEITFGAGSLGREEARFRARRRFASGLALSVSGGQASEDGVLHLYYPEYDAADTNFGIADRRDYMRRKNLFARADYRGWSISGSYNARRRGLPTGAYEVLFNHDSWVDDGHARVDVNWNGKLGHSWNATLRTAFDRYEFEGSYPYDWDDDASTPIVDYIDKASGHWWTAEAQVSRAFGSRHEVTVGVEYRRNIAQKQYSYLRDPFESLWSDDRRTATEGIYIQDQLRLTKRLRLNFGLRQDHYSAFRDPVKPRFAAIYQPTDATTVKFMYGNAFRAPNVYESYYIQPGLWTDRPNLGPEEIQTVETVVEHYAGKRFRVSAGAFRYAVDKLIDFTADSNGLLLFANLGTARATGVEAEIEAKWPSGLQARVSYAFADATISDTGEPLSNSPRHVTQGLVSVPLFNGVFASGTIQALSTRLSRMGTLVPAYVRPDVSITAPIRNSGGRVTFAVTNLTNETYSDPASDDFAQNTIAQNGRTSRLFVSWAF